MNILLVENHVGIRHRIQQIISIMFPAAFIVEADDGDKAVKIVACRKWDIILLDISMPGLNGIDVLMQIRKNGILAPILMLSMYPESQYATRVLKEGASGFLNKQNAAEELPLAINKVLLEKVLY